HLAGAGHARRRRGRGPVGVLRPRARGRALSPAKRVVTVTITRREFIHRAAGAVALGAGGSWALAAPDDRAWAFPFLGDLHIDRPGHHDMDWLAKEHPNDVSQVRNYCRITQDVTPKLLDVARRPARESRDPVPLVL